MIGIVQARMGSTRLPGKVLADVAGCSMLGRVVTRLRRAERLAEVVVATTRRPDDAEIEREAARLGARTFRGDEHDVLDRYHRATEAFGADVIVRITADCPLLDPALVDDVIEALLRASPEADVASNVLRRRYPRGLDVETARREALACAWRQARQPHERAHVFPYLYAHADQFRIVSVDGPEEHAGLRWTVDTAEDLEFVRAVYERLGAQETAGWRDVLALLAREPELTRINAAVAQKRVEAG